MGTKTAVLLALLAAGCPSGMDEFDPAADDDEDGSPAATDCDDSDPDVGGPTSWFLDADGDGFGDYLESRAACDAPPGHVADLTDCDDSDPLVNPAAVEVCNGVDDDCDRAVDLDAEDMVLLYPDADGDGFGDQAAGSLGCPEEGLVTTGADCDDADPDVHPGVEEVCNDGVDNDCDGERCLFDAWLEADARLLGCPGAHAGWCAGAAGDFDGDGHSNLLVGAPEADTGAGRAFLVPGDVSGEVALADVATASFVGNATGDLAGWSCAGAGDVDADGLDDVLVGAGGRDPPWVALFFGGEVEGETRLSEGDVHITLGRSSRPPALGGADVDGDGHSDLLVGDPSGRDLAIFAGASLEEEVALDLEDAHALVEGANGGPGSVSTGDTDGDGLADLFVGDSSYNGDLGRVGVFLGGTLEGKVDLASGEAQLLGEEAGWHAGAAVAAGDADGDGYADLLVGAPKLPDPERWSEVPGGAYLVRGPVTSDENLGRADLCLVGAVHGGEAGKTLDIAPDMDGDGADEIAVGAPSAVRVYLVLGGGAWSGVLDLGTADAALVTGASGGGDVVRGAGDVDGDGYGDLLVGLPSLVYDDGGVLLVRGVGF